MNKKLIMFGAIAGSLLGGYVPTFFGVSAFSFTSVMGGLIGGILGIWITYKLVD